MIGFADKGDCKCDIEWGICAQQGLNNSEDWSHSMVLSSHAGLAVFALEAADPMLEVQVSNAWSHKGSLGPLKLHGYLQCCHSPFIKILFADGLP